MLKDYENPDIIDEEPSLEEASPRTEEPSLEKNVHEEKTSPRIEEKEEVKGIENKEKWEEGREEKKIEESKPYPKKKLEEIEKEIDVEIIDAIKNIQDPELGVDIWSLGLIYDINKNSKLDIVMTFTSPACPYGPQIVSELKSGLKEKGYEEEGVNIDIVFNPLWEPSEELKDALGYGD